MAPTADGSSICATRPSLASRLSVKASPASASPGDPPPGRSALRALAGRYGIRPSKALGQHFLADPNLARAIALDAGVGPGDRVVEIGAGLGSLTIALAETGCEVLALEFDRALLPALTDVLDGRRNVRVEEIDATHAEWRTLLDGGPWTLVASLPYNVSVPLVVELLDDVPAIERFVVMVQREVAERFVARPGMDGYGPVSIRVAFHASAETLRRIPRDVFWPRPNVDSVTVRLTRRAPPGNVDAALLFRIVDTAFAERRKTVGNAIRRLGLDPGVAAHVLRSIEIEPAVRPEEMGLDAFVRLARALLAAGWRP